MKKGIPCTWKSKESRVAILISDKINFKLKIVVRGKGHFLMVKAQFMKKI